MADFTATMRVGEKRRLYGSVTASAGTLQIQGVPTVSLFGGCSGAVAGGVDGAECVGWDTAAQGAVRAWYDLDTTALGLSPDDYVIVFALAVMDGGGAQSRVEVEGLVFVNPIP